LSSAKTGSRGSLLHFLVQTANQRQLILSLARRDLVAQYAGSFLGLVWTFIHPLVLIFVFWFVFSVGFKAKPMGEVPFVVWLTAGMMPWFLFADILSSSAGIVVIHTNLIKKTLFPAQILPLVRVVVALVTHAVFLVLLLVLLFLQHLEFTPYFLQFFYYVLCATMLALGFSWLVAALHVFIRDVAPMVGIVLQLGFWVTPIFWDIKMMPEKVQLVLKLNPMFYVVQGYRDSFIGTTGFWQHPVWTIYFWLVTLAALLAGMYVFDRLRPQFADVL